MYTQSQYDSNYNTGYSSGRTQGRSDVTSAPNNYSLYTKAQYDANYNQGKIDGVTVHSGTKTISSNTTTDLGEKHNIRYIKTNVSHTYTKKSLGSITGTNGNTATYNCTSIPNYQNLSVNNFYVHVTGASLEWQSSTVQERTVNTTPFNLSYNASSGILTISCGEIISSLYTGVYSRAKLNGTVYAIY